jgi:hypothetical protein
LRGQRPREQDECGETARRGEHQRFVMRSRGDTIYSSAMNGYL